MKQQPPEDDFVEDATDKFHRLPYGDSGVSGYNLLDGYVRDEGEPFFSEETRHEPSRPPKFPLIPWADINFDVDEEWRVERVLPKVKVSCFYGGPGTVKSFVVVHLLVSVARGVPWGGRDVMQAPVVYIAAEGASGIKKRIAGLKKALAEQGVTGNVPFYLITVAPNLGTGQEDLKELLSCIKAACANPGIIAIDTLAQSLGSADENGAGMVQFVANATALANQLQCHVATIHHVPLSDD
jgi:hypothetical protein